MRVTVLVLVAMLASVVAAEESIEQKVERLNEKAIEEFNKAKATQYADTVKENCESFWNSASREMESQKKAEKLEAYIKCIKTTVAESNDDRPLDVPMTIVLLLPILGGLILGFSCIYAMNRANLKFKQRNSY